MNLSLFIIINDETNILKKYWGKINDIFNFIIDAIVKNIIIQTIKYYICDLKHIIIIMIFKNDRYTYHKDWWNWNYSNICSFSRYFAINYLIF